MKRCVIRLATADDGPALTALHSQVWDDTTTPTGGPPQALHPERKTFVAEEDGRVVGAVQLGPRSSYPSNAHVGVLSWLAVSPSHRGHGVGAVLVQAVLEAARAQGLRKVSLSVLSTNLPALRLYERLGFLCEGRRKAEYFLQDSWVDSLEYARAP